MDLEAQSNFKNPKKFLKKIQLHSQLSSICNVKKDFIHFQLFIHFQISSMFRDLTIWQNVRTCDQIFPWRGNVCSKNLLSMWYKLFWKNSFRLVCSCSFAHSSHSLVRFSNSCVHKLALLGWIQICYWVFLVTCLKQYT